MNEKIKNYYHVRLYDLNVVKSINELMQTGDFESANDLLSKAIAIGIEKIYLEYGKRKALAPALKTPEVPESQKLDDLDHKLNQIRLTVEDVLILLNSVELLSASNLNLFKASINGEPISEELIDSGYFAQLPPIYQEIKEKITQRYNRKFHRGQDKK